MSEPTPRQIAEASTRGTWTSALTGIEFQQRALTQRDLYQCPDLIPFATQLSAMASKRHLENPPDDAPAHVKAIHERRLAEYEAGMKKVEGKAAEIELELMQRTTISPRILAEGDPDPDGIPVDMLLPEDHAQLVQNGLYLTSGLAARERLVAALQAASFRSESERRDSPRGPGPAGRESIEVDRGDSPDP